MLDINLKCIIISKLYFDYWISSGSPTKMSVKKVK